MFSRILSGAIDWNKATPERKLEALDQVAAEDPILAQLALQDADAGVRHRALQRMNGAALWDLAPSVRPGDEDVLAARLAELAAEPAAAADVPAPLLHAGAALRIAVIAHTRSEELAAALLATLDEDAERARVARGNGPIAVRVAAARALRDAALLEELAREFRDRQRQVYRAARERADELLAAQDARARARALCEQMEAAVAAQQVTLSAVVQVEREFQALSPLPPGDGGAELQARYERALAGARVLLQGQADIGRELDRIKVRLRSLAERSQADEAVEAGNLAALVAERQDCAQSLADERFQALARERSQLLENVEQLAERHAVLSVESQALAAARGHVEALRHDAGALTPAWRAQFAQAAAILRPALRAAVEQQAQTLTDPIDAERRQQHDAERAAGQQLRTDIETVVKQLETSLDKGQRQQALDLEQVLAEKRANAEGQRPLPPALEFRIRRCKERLAKLADWKRFGDTHAREALCREAEALARRVSRQEQPAAPRGFVAPLENFAWPVSPETAGRIDRQERPPARGFVAPLESFAWPMSPARAQAAQDAPASPRPFPAAPAEEILSVEQIAQAVRDLQARWHQLDAAKGASSKALWERFRRACDRAYAPARKHFEEREQQRAGNAEKKQAILDRLAALDERIADGANWGRLLSERGELIRGWFAAGAPPRKQAQALQKRYDALSAEVDAKLDARRQTERARRQDLIERAKAIAEKPADGGSLSAMIALQKQWQEGMSGAIRLKAGEDKALWDAFRAAGNTLFGKRDAEKAGREAGRKAQLEDRRALLAELQTLSGDAGKDIAALKRGMDELASRWQAMPWPERRPLREWEQRFSAARAAVSDRIAGIRHEAEQQQRAAALARLAVVERAEQALAAGSSPDIAAVRAELQAMLGEGEKLDAAATARLQALEEAIKAGPEAWRARAGKLEAERDALLLELEIVLDLPSPPELASARRMRMLQRLAESKNARSTPPLMAPDAPKAVERLLAMPGGMPGAQERVKAILAAAGRARK